MRMTEEEFRALQAKRQGESKSPGGNEKFPRDFLQAEAERLSRQHAATRDDWSESRIQIEGVKLVREFLKVRQLPSIMIYSIPNGADVADHHRVRLVQEGLTAGVADLFLMWQPGLYIEVKRPGEALRANQKAFRDWAIYLGFKHCVARSPEEIRDAVINHIDSPPR